MDPNLLQSQFDTLEEPTYGIHISIDQTPDIMVQSILNTSTTMKNNFGIIGLGVMGKSLALNAAEKGINVSVYNRASESEKFVGNSIKLYQMKNELTSKSSNSKFPNVLNHQ